MFKKTLKAALSFLLIGILLLQLAGCAESKPSKPAGETPTGAKPAGEDPVPGQSGSVDLMSAVVPNRGEAAPLDREAAAAAADFALRLFRAGNVSDKNVLLSPLSVLCALAMTANGAKEETLRQMEATLGLDRDSLNAFVRSYLDALGKDGALKLANAIWFTSHQRFTVNQEFLQTNADYYGAEIYQAPFDDTTLADINNWVKAKTDDMIPRILDKSSPSAVMYLVNALAFEAKWEEPYESYSVQDGEFTLENGTKRDVKLMYSTEQFYLEDKNAVGFLKRYEGGRYAFAALLPREGLSVDEYLKNLDGEALAKLLAEPQAETVYAALPKFETDYGTELSGVLAGMGMELAFDDELANFSGLGHSEAGNISISRVIHKTYIDVNETGTKAAAATVVEMTDGAMFIEDPKEVYLDRPFVYMLIDCETNLPFFLGVMRDPA